MNTFDNKTRDREDSLTFQSYISRVTISQVLKMTKVKTLINDMSLNLRTLLTTLKAQLTITSHQIMNLMRGIVQSVNEWKKIEWKKEQARNVLKNEEIVKLHKDNNWLQQITKTLRRELRMKTKENNKLQKKRITNASREKWQYWKLSKLSKVLMYNEKKINNMIKRWLTQMQTHFQRKYEFTEHKTTLKQIIIMRSTQLENHAIWQWTIETQIEEVDTTKVMSQMWLKFKDWIMNMYNERDVLTKWWNWLKKIKQIESFKTFQLQFQNAV
jgi:hypothetical protein